MKTKVAAEEEYRMASREGDIVMLSSGVVGIVTHRDIICGGNVKEVRVYPFTNMLYWLWLAITFQLEFYDGDINKLKLLLKANLAFD